MIKIEKIDTHDKSQVRRFIQIPYRLYKKNAFWVPPLFADAETQLDRKKHPYYEHSDADFFVATRDKRDVGRIAVLENRRYNQYHSAAIANFYLFECEEDYEIAGLLFERVYEWSHARSLNQLVGPKGFGVLDGYGMMIEGYEQRQLMTMTNYNFPYYPDLMEFLGFEKEVDFVSHYLSAEVFTLPERIHTIAARVLARGSLQIQRFRNKNELKAWAGRIGMAYNQAFVNNWEYYPLTDNEISFLLSNLLTIADPRLIKVITNKDVVVGFIFGFPDLSAGLQRARGKLFPLGLIKILIDMRRTTWIAINGAGILPEFQGRGGNALLYSEMENTIKEYKFQHAELAQVAESAVHMRKDLENIGGKPLKNHRVYRKIL